ncbi:hypothetical protein XH98_00080 [Bradyrhizobium sp. CCBAU 51745]|uniref:glycosyl transferase n=1 Tax=Bradyrhizobium sp. CCBAU 51745 TaxID=1325099 RepID=UPI0023053361|nr:glycosyl transferase [Bradyrhizobium sp. CCBAU 51745]MDA9437534.1 hypothetical protein [Bradyrhizobium sp. CCBAU 51745]
MIALCTESSHTRGMGHLFRAMVLAEGLRAAGHAVKFYVNDHPATAALLTQRGLPFEVVPLEDVEQNWEGKAIERDDIKVWVFDRHRTDQRSAHRIKAKDIPLVTFDDRGGGAALADLHIAAMPCEDGREFAGKRVLTGIRYLMLDPAIAAFRRQRSAVESMVVTLGGADTYGVTMKIMRLLSGRALRKTVILGPAFLHENELAPHWTSDFVIKRSVPSLIEEFARHDVAVTGGGMTPFEANAAGLPCVVVANEDFEIPVGRELAKLGGAVFAGHHSALDESLFALDLPVAEMSRAGMQAVPIDGTQRVVEAIVAL